jgi:hypothetical protein
LAAFGTNLYSFYKKLKFYFILNSQREKKNVMKENEQIIWNILFLKQNYSKLFNYSANMC